MLVSLSLISTVVSSCADLPFLINSFIGCMPYGVDNFTAVKEQEELYLLSTISLQNYYLSCILPF